MDIYELLAQAAPGMRSINVVALDRGGFQVSVERKEKPGRFTVFINPSLPVAIEGALKIFAGDTDWSALNERRYWRYSDSVVFCTPRGIEPSQACEEITGEEFAQLKFGAPLPRVPEIKTRSLEDDLDDLVG